MHPLFHGVLFLWVLLALGVIVPGSAEVFNGTVVVNAGNIGRSVRLLFDNSQGNVAVSVVTTVQKILNATGEGFRITATHDLLHMFKDHSEGFSSANTEIVFRNSSSFTGATYSNRWGPCTAVWMQQKNNTIAASSVFFTNHTASLQILMEADFLDTTIQKDQKRPISASVQDFATFVPTNMDSDYNVTFVLTSAGVALNQLLASVIVGCGGSGKIFDLSHVTEASWQGSAIVSRGTAAYFVFNPKPEGIKTRFIVADLQFEVVSAQPHDEDDDDFWRWWVILLVAGGGGAALLVAAVVVGAGVFVWMRRRHSYEPLN